METNTSMKVILKEVVVAVDFPKPEQTILECLSGPGSVVATDQILQHI